MRRPALFPQRTRIHRAAVAGAVWIALLPLSAQAQSAASAAAPVTAGPAAYARLPSDELARQALERQPAVQQARRALLAAQHSAGMLNASPHEWTLDAGLQQRRADSGARGNEWSLGLQRTLRLPGKADLDQQLGDAGQREASARAAAAWQGAASELLERWLELVAARAQRALQAQQLTFARQSQDAVERRLRAGDAAPLERLAAQADVADVERQLAAARSAEARALRRLQQQYPAEAEALAASAELSTESSAEAPLPPPEALTAEGGPWQRRLLACDAELRAAQASADRADLLARRVEAERRPDPTVGVRSAAEAYRTERVIGLTLSIPLGGSYREQAAREAWQQAQAGRAELDGRRRGSELAALERVADVEDGLQRWQLADRAARASRESARLMQRAHALGEADLQPTLQARRLALDAQRNALDAHLAAWQATWRLQLDTGRLWAPAGGGCAAGENSKER